MIKALAKKTITFCIGLMPPKVLFFLEAEINARKLSHILNDLQTKYGVKLSTVYDIGAHKGDWAKFIKTTLPAAEVFLFEANDMNEDHLKRSGFWYWIGILSDTAKDVAFYGEGGTGASYYKENTGAYSDVAPSSRRSDTLDDVVSTAGLPKPDFIKIDTQGSEVDIMRGATACLENAQVVLLECPVYPYNVGAPDMGEIVEFMLGNALYPMASVEVHDRFGVFVQVDIVFIKKSVLKMMNPDFETFYMAR